MDQDCSSSTAKAERLIQLRMLAKLSRKDISQMADVSVLTYKGWENARFGGIPPKRALLLVERLQQEGIRSSVDWILHGTGELPKKLFYYQIAQFKEAIADYAEQQSPEIIEQLRIKAELEFFCNNNDQEVIFTTVTDDAMLPYFLQGDVVAGVKGSSVDLDKIVGFNCIIRTTNKVLLRQIQKSNTKGIYILFCLNPSSKQQLVLHDTDIIEIAPVIWFRRNAILSLKNS